MNYSIIYRLLSVIMSALTLAFAVSLGVAFYYVGSDIREDRAIWGFAGSMGIAATLALTCYLLGRKGSSRMFSKEALAIIGIGWITASLVGALPYLLVGGLSVADSVFESTSGLTTTGASVIPDVEGLPRSLLFWRSTSQWIGGLGVVVFFVAILTFLGAGAKILFSRESSAQAADLDSARVQSGINKILIYYILLSIAAALAYWAAGMNLYDAINHSMTSISTGGFSTRSESMAYWQSPLIQWLCILFMIIGGTSFLAQIRFIQKDYKALTRNSEVRAYLLIMLVATVATALFNIMNHSMEGAHDIVRHSAFQVVSILTSTGFATVDFNHWFPVLHVLLLVLMAIGGCSGSTAGGIKVLRVIVAMKVMVVSIEKSFRSRVVRSIKANGQSVDATTQQDIAVFIMMMSLVLTVGVLIVALAEPYMSFEGTISAAFACLFNIGPGFAEVGPFETFVNLHLGTKYFLSLLMIMGRVELFAILALFSPSLWKHY